MQTITIAQMGQAIEHVAVRLNSPCFFWGRPGLGKTVSLYALAATNQWLVVDVRLGQYESIDLRGIPVPDHDIQQTVWYAPLTLPFKGNPKFDTPENKGKTIILFLDEANQCHPSVYGVTMQLTNERRIGEFELMDEVRIVLCGNRETDRGVTTRMPTTVANRLVHFELTGDVDGWCYWAQDHGIDPVIVAFIQYRKELLSTFDPAKPDKAFATERTWEKANTFFSDPLMPEDIKQASISGVVGQGPAAELWGFKEVWSKITPIKDILKDPSGVPLPDRGDLRYATTVSVSGYMETDTIAALHTYLMRLDPEFGILAWQLALRRSPPVAATKEFVDFAKKYRTVFA